MKPIFLAKKVRKENSIIGDEHIVASFLDFRGRIHYVDETAFKILSLCNGEKAVKEILETIERDRLVKRFGSIAGVYNVLLEGLRRGFLTNDGECFKGFKPEIEGEPPRETLLNYLYAPSQVLFEITYRCNLKCLHCYAARDSRNELSLDEILELANQLIEMPVLQVSVGGGEPLLRFEELIELVKKLTSRRIDVIVATNGTLLDEEKALELKKAGLLTLQFSLDGIGKVHDSIRGVTGSFEKVVEAIKLAKGLGFKVIIKTIAQRANLGQLYDLFRLVNELGVDGWSVNRVIPSGRAKANFQRVHVSFKEFDRTVQPIREFARRAAGILSISMEDYPRPFEEEPLADDYAVCPAGTTSIHISPDGSVKPCSYFPDSYICGNVRREPLIDIWNNSPILKTMRRLRRSDLLEPCRSCKLPCNGRCRGAAASFYGDVRAPDPLCPMVEPLLGV